MAWLISLLGVSIIILILRLIFIKKEIKNITNQLNNYNEFKTKKKLDINLLDDDIESLAESINNHIEISKSDRIKQIRADEELKSLITNISHDLRTPLTSIIGYLQMLKTQNLSDEKRNNYLKIAERRSKDLQELINNFFTISIIEANQYNINLELLNLNDIVFNVITSFYDQLNSKGIEPEINILKEDIYILGDISAVKRVLENLIINVLNHSEGEVTIKLERNNENAILTIINAAKNLTENEAELIFNKFYKGDKSRNSNKDSTGLGLAIVKELMKKMNGSVSSKVNSGLIYIYCNWNIAKV